MDGVRMTWAVGFQIMGFGIAIGISQWLVLQHQVKKSFWWILATVVGWSAVLINTEPYAFPNPRVIVFGLLIGFLQWLVLRQWADRAGWWIPINTATWLIAYVIGIVASAILSDENVIVLGFIAGGIIGLITGPFLIWVLRFSNQKFQID